MTRMLLFLGCFIVNITLAQSTDEPVENPNRLTHYNMPSTITTKEGVVHKGMIAYKEYGKRLLYFSKENSVKVVPENIISADQGLDSIRSITIFNTKLNEEFVFIPVKVYDELEIYQLRRMVEDNSGYIEYAMFITTKRSFSISDDPAPAGSVIPGYYENVIFHKKLSKYYFERQIHSLKKNIEKYVDYCPEVTNKVKTKEKGYKTNLMMRGYGLLKKVILEAEEVCLK